MNKYKEDHYYSLRDLFFSFKTVVEGGTYVDAKLPWAQNKYEWKIIIPFANSSGLKYELYFSIFLCWGIYGTSVNNLIADGRENMIGNISRQTFPEVAYMIDNYLLPRIQGENIFRIPPEYIDILEDAKGNLKEPFTFSNHYISYADNDLWSAWYEIFGKKIMQMYSYFGESAQKFQTRIQAFDDFAADGWTSDIIILSDHRYNDTPQDTADPTADKFITDYSQDTVQTPNTTPANRMKEISDAITAIYQAWTDDFVKTFKIL